MLGQLVCIISLYCILWTDSQTGVVSGIDKRWFLNIIICEINLRYYTFSLFIETHSLVLIVTERISCFRFILYLWDLTLKRFLLWRKHWMLDVFNSISFGRKFLISVSSILSCTRVYLINWEFMYLYFFWLLHNNFCVFRNEVEIFYLYSEWFLIWLCFSFLYLFTLWTYLSRNLFSGFSVSISCLSFSDDLWLV